MNFWWVNHKQTYKQEVFGGYLWSPTTNRDGTINQTYLNMSRTLIGDMVFSYANAEIKAVGYVSATCTAAKQPEAFGDIGNQWSRNGWLVPVRWTILTIPFSPRPKFSEIAHLLPVKYSPLRPPGVGNQKFYLAEISRDLAGILLGLISKENPELHFPIE